MFPLHGLGLGFGSLSQWLLNTFYGWISIQRTDFHHNYIHFNQGSESESEPMEISCILQESESESDSESSNGNKPFHAKLICKFTVHSIQLTTSKKMQRRLLILILLSMILVQRIYIICSF